MITAQVLIPKEEINRMSRTMSHWVNVSKMLYDSKDEAFILKLLKVELSTRNRYYIVQRVYAHYNSIRRRRELEEIRKWPSQKNPQNDISETTSEISEAKS